MDVIFFLGRSFCFFHLCLPFSLHQLLHTNISMYNYSPCCSLHISKGADKENLFTNQRLFQFVTISFTLVNFMLYSGWCKEKLVISHSWGSRCNVPLFLSVKICLFLPPYQIIQLAMLSYYHIACLKIGGVIWGFGIFL